MILERAAHDPEGLAVSDLTRTRSWAELADRATRTARFLREEAGIPPGAHAAIARRERLGWLAVAVGVLPLVLARVHPWWDIPAVLGGTDPLAQAW